MYYGSPFYIFSLLFLLILTAAAWFLLRRCSPKTCRWVIFGLSLINLAQHLLKAWLYPQYRGQGFSYLSTAYNVCATLIILLPFALLCKNRFLKNFLFITGTAAGIAAIAVPFWFIGSDISTLGWNYFRFYFCHALLFISAILPLLLGMHRPKLQEFWHVGCGFLLVLCIILINNFVCVSVGLYPGASVDTFYESMLQLNPCGLMGPPAEFPWVVAIVAPLSPSVFMGNNPTGLYVPILWYAIPVFLGISLLSIAIFSAINWKEASAIWRRLRDKCWNLRKA